MKKLLLYFVVCCMLLTGCSSSSHKASDDLKQQYSFEVGEMKKSILDGDKYAIVCHDRYLYVKSDEEDDKSYLIDYDADSGKESIIYSFEDETPLLMTANSEKIVFITRKWLENGEVKTYVNIIKDNTVKNCEITESVNDGSFAVNSDIMIDDKGDIWFVINEGEVNHVTDAGLVSGYETEGEVYGLFINDAGNASYVSYDNNDLRICDLVNNSSQSIEIPEETQFDIEGLAKRMYQAKLIIMTGEEGFFVDTANQSITPFINAKDIFRSNMSECSFLVEDDQIYLYEGSKSDKLHVNSFKLQQVVGAVKEKEELVLGVFGTSDDLVDSIREYNLTHQEYRISLKNYADWAMEDGGLSAFTKDLIDGNVPDIMMINEKMNPYQLVDKGIFCDMREFLRNDSELSEADFMPGILEACTYHDCLYALPESFSLGACIGLEDNFSKINPFSLNKIDEYMSEDEKLIFSSLGDPMIILANLLVGDERSYINDGGLCVSKEDLAELLTCSKSFGERLIPEGADLYDCLYQGELLLIYDKSVSPSFISQELPGLANEKKQISIEGLPWLDTERTYVDIPIEYAISSFCRNKEAAWDFVRQLFVDEGKRELTGTEDRFSALKGVTEDFLEASQCDSKHKEQLERLLSRKMTIYNSENEISKIIVSEAGLYFDGERTLTETVDILYSRLGIYAEERR